MTDPHDPARDADLEDVETIRSLFSALADGELSDAETLAVQRVLARDADLAAEYASICAVRDQVRDLPAVDPPFGFYERMLRAGDPEQVEVASRSASARRTPPQRRKVWPPIAATLGAAAAMVLILGITPVTDSFVPPIEAYAARHDEMAAPDPAVPTPAAATPPTTASSTMDFEPVPMVELDDMAAPYEIPEMINAGSTPRMSGYQSDDGVLHVVYGKGLPVVSIFQQTGEVGWEHMPAGGHQFVVGGDMAWEKTWETSRGPTEVVVIERAPVIYTIVMRPVPSDVMMTMAQELHVAEPSMMDQAAEGCRTVVNQFGFGS